MKTIQDIYEERLENFKYRAGGVQLDAPCPFHKSKTGAPFTVNVETGFFKCFNPECIAYSGGNLEKFLELTKDKNKNEILKSIKKKKVYLSEEDVIKYHAKLLKSDAILKLLEIHSAFTLKTIKQFKLGWDGIRIWIPIYIDDKLVNIRKYNPILEAKTIGVKGFNSPTLFPYSNVYKDEIYLCAGEKDTILANQLGLNALTITGGEGVFPQKEISRFHDKTIYIIHDVDKAGERAVNKLFLLLRKVAKKIIKVTLPVNYPNKDLTEYIVNEEKTLEDLLEVIHNGKTLFDKDQEKDSRAIKLSLNDLKNPEYYNNRVITKAMVIGKDIDPFIVPKKVKFQCNNPSNKKSCAACPIIGEAIEIDYDTKDIIRFTDITDAQLEKLLTEKAFIPRCPSVDVDKKEIIALYRVQLQTPITSYSSEDKPTTTQGYILQHDVEANKTYICEGILTTEPRTQYTTLVIDKIDPTNTDIDNFTLDEEWMERLKKIFS